jgi:hypothetical protein
VGYDVHITRAADSVDSETNSITLDEWVAFAEAAGDLAREGSTQVPHWPGFYNLRVGDIETWLDWADGAIYTKNPPAPVRARMYEIAQALGARVQGDEGELYDERGEQVPGTAPAVPARRRREFFGDLIGLPLMYALNSYALGQVAGFGVVLALVCTVAAIPAAFFVFDGFELAIAVGAAVLTSIAIYSWIASRGGAPRV